MADRPTTCRACFYDTLHDLLAETYTPDGVEVWLNARHVQFGGLTADEMFMAGRADEVLAAAESLTGQVAT